MNPMNWSSFNQSDAFTDQPENSFLPSVFKDTDDVIRLLPNYPYNHKINEDQYNSNIVNLLPEKLKQKDNLLTFSTSIKSPHCSTVITSTKKNQNYSTPEVAVDDFNIIEPPSLSTTSSSSIVLSTGIRRRGPKKKKKPDSQERLVRMKMRRARANARERSRMHGLNSALDTLRQHILPSALVNGDISLDRNSPYARMQINHNAINSDRKNQQSTTVTDQVSSTSTTINNNNNNNRNMSNLHQFGQKLSKIETLRLACNYIGLLASILNNIQFDSITDIIKYLCHGLSQITTNQIAAALHSDPSRLLKHYTFDKRDGEGKEAKAEVEAQVETMEKEKRTSSTIEGDILLSSLASSSSSSLSKMSESLSKSTTSTTPPPTTTATTTNYWWIDSPMTEGGVHQTEKLPTGLMRSNVLEGKLTTNEERLIDYIDCQQTIPPSIQMCSSKCRDLIKNQNYYYYYYGCYCYYSQNISSLSIHQHNHHHHHHHQVEMDEYNNSTLTDLPVNYYTTENKKDNQPIGVNHLENWFNKTKVSRFNDEERNFTSSNYVNNNNNNNNNSNNNNKDGLQMDPYSYHCYSYCNSRPDGEYYDSCKLMVNTIHANSTCIDYRGDYNERYNEK
ncbi:unnamed protein product [Trichobilharzia szidati]|nr:unnamed protein product [Trichobilharzia szidati]